MVFTRIRGESFYVGTGTERALITVLGTQKGGRVQIGIDAPKAVPVYRKEIQDKIDQETAADPRYVPIRQRK